MKSFQTHLEESKNLHMEHVEDLVLNGGVAGAREAINFLRAVRDMLAGNADSRVNITVKWDGAPAVFAGVDPRDGEFFVAKKGIFNKTPKIYKTEAEIKADTSGDLQNKLILALKHFRDLGITNVVQGDFLFSSDDIKKATIDGEEYLTFQPNTIVYAVPAKSKLAREIRSAKIGVVWHTSYEGESFENMRANYTDSIDEKLRKNKNVFTTDAEYRDVSGAANMTKKETDEITKILSEAGTLFRSIDAKTLNGISEDPELLTRVKTFNNTKVRSGERIRNVRKHVDELIDHILGYYGAEEEKRKTERGKATPRAKKAQVMRFFSNTNKKNLEKIFQLQNLLVDAKQILINKLNRVKTLGTFVLTDQGYKVTGQEGFVAIDKLKGDAVKLVDRMEFSYNNFSPNIKKGWQR